MLLLEAIRQASHAPAEDTGTRAPTALQTARAASPSGATSARPPTASHRPIGPACGHHGRPPTPKSVVTPPAPEAEAPPRPKGHRPTTTRTPREPTPPQGHADRHGALGSPWARAAPSPAAGSAALRPYAQGCEPGR